MSALARRRAREAGLGHHEDQPHAERDLQEAADHDRHPQLDVREPDRHDDGDESADLTELLGPQEDAGERGLADLTREPRFGCPARERVGDAPEDLCGHDRGDVRVRAFQYEADTHPDVADDDREPPAVDVGDDAGRDLEDEDRGLHERPDEHQLERVQPGGLDPVEGRDREHDGREERAAGRDHEKDEPRPPHGIRASQTSSRRGTLFECEHSGHYVALQCTHSARGAAAGAAAGGAVCGAVLSRAR